MTAGTLPALLARLEAVLDAQLHALDGGHADGLAPLGAQLQACMADLVRTARGPLARDQQERARTLLLRCAAAQLFATRRAQAAQAALEALGQGDSRLQASRLAGTYGRTGALTGGLARAGFELA